MVLPALLFGDTVFCRCYCGPIARSPLLTIGFVQFSECADDILQPAVSNASQTSVAARDLWLAAEVSFSSV